jgi:hypothetical protein
MKSKVLAVLVALVLSFGFVVYTVWAGSGDCYTCISGSTGKCKDMMYCKGSEKACKAAGCRIGSSSKTSCPTSANYKAKTCTP